MTEDEKTDNPIPEDDQAVDVILRPKQWDDYIGQEKVKENLRIIIDAAKMRSKPVDHILFYGQAGLGKTTLAKLISRELGANIKTTSGPAIEKVGDLAAILSNLEEDDMLFIDEAHRLNKMIEEVLYPAMESRKLNIIIGKGTGARTISLDLPPFSLVAATTRVNLLSAPLRSRFGATFKLDYYNDDDIEKIIKRSAKILDIEIDDEGAMTLAKAARSTPRVANRLLRRTRDYMDVKGYTRVDRELALKILEFLDIDELGLERHDKNFLKTIIEKFSGGPVGVNTIAAALNEDTATIEEVYEPYLMKIGFLRRTSSGRIVEPAAYKHLGLSSEHKLI
ncbi:MAG: Holliday junction branch migration DNA helicase RuvB [Candidatus Colwellbacteria bacterium CG10_big_fil_rev_8_21_14_0_10_41_28]|uniref:Holliday junction branch migration complex subunit RuvB n=1 Tax=Candidatus Colwellbacteria bacterium CG10_big_fil_rev_8_21_14_0_10_41_28 TaxID=1974539 RepID=A0A2H0VHP3_9BACT|nr:MAG: Holliday junction branch migration DNA helicase RuvB [Candidatus Colwellbacteria bacterium CG10_big_fil_rev_8_21_14_0_10_41_28]